MAETVKLFWQPGCTSCLRTKEFLTRRGVAFESVNVHGNEAAWAELQRLGPRSVPVVSKGDRFVFAQVLDDVAKFLGLELNQHRLSPAELATRLDDVLAIAQAGVRQIPDAALGDKLPGRNRSYRELGHHIFRIPEAFLESVGGRPLAAEHVNQGPPEELQTAEQIAAYGAAVQRRWREWWAAATDRDGAREMATYYGVKPMHLVLERTCWHSTQHTRQLEMVLGILKLPIPRPLTPALLSTLMGIIGDFVPPSAAWRNAAQ